MRERTRELAGPSRKNEAERVTCRELPPPLSVRGVFSDALYEPWLAAAAPIQRHWLSRQTIERNASAISAADFVAKFETPGLPVLLSNVAGAWPALCTPGWPESSRADLGLASARFEAFDEFVGAVPLSWEDYGAYARQVKEERPLYIFEPRFQEKLPAMAGDVGVPPCFAEDLFACLPEGVRPDYRWLLRGPARTGTNFHVDPNFTAAWNTVIRGKKKWLLFPPGVTPPGVTVMPDGTVRQPESVMAWFLRYYDQVHGDGAAGRTATSDKDTTALEWHARAVECTCGPGDTVFIPAGWWHLVLNLEDTVAYTQNYVARSNLPDTLAFLATGEPRHMTHAGPQNLHALFEAALQTTHSDVLKEANAATQTRGAGRHGGGKRSLWDAWQQPELNEGQGSETAAGEEPTGAAFSFSFS